MKGRKKKINKTTLWSTLEQGLGFQGLNSKTLAKFIIVLIYNDEIFSKKKTKQTEES